MINLRGCLAVVDISVSGWERQWMIYLREWLVPDDTGINSLASMEDKSLRMFSSS